MVLPQSPLSNWYNWLLLGFPGIWLLARSMVFNISSVPERRAVILPGLVITIWLLSIHIFGLIFNSFGIALILGTVLPSCSGWYFYRYSASQRVGWPSVPLLLLSLMATSYLLPAMIDTDFHDKLELRCSHFSTTNNILNGFYPPRDPVFPQKSLHYHYGVDTLAAIISALTRTPYDISLDIISFVGFAYTILAFGTLGGALFGGWAGRIFTALLGAFHGGFPWPYLAKEDESPAHFLMGLFHHVRGSWLSTPSTSTLFQMPFSVGYPVFALTLLLALEIDGKKRGFVLAIALFAALATQSFSNITLFLTTAGALLGSTGLLMTYRIVRKAPDVRFRYFLTPFFAIAASFIAAIFIAGFAEIILKNGPSVLLKTRGGIAGDLTSNLYWHWGSFGILLPLAIPGLLLSPALRAFFLFHIIGSLYVLNSYKYAYTWDIVKFAFVASISLSILCAGAICWMWRRHWITKPLALACAAIIASSAVSFHIPFWQKYPSLLGRSLYFGGLGRVTVLPDELKTIEWLRSHASQDAVILRVMEAASLYPSLGGLAIIQPDILTIQFGHPFEWVKRRQTLSDNISSDLAEYKREGVQWVVVDTNPGVGDPYVSRVTQWAKDGACVLEATFGTFQVYRVI